MVPFQLVMRRSSPSSRPYEQASVTLSGSLVTTQSDALMHTSTEALLALLELLQQTEVTGNLGHVVTRSVVVNSWLEEAGATESSEPKSRSKGAKMRFYLADGHKHGNHQRHSMSSAGTSHAHMFVVLTNSEATRPPSLGTYPFG
jgi:hypothetical protein